MTTRQFIIFTEIHISNALLVAQSETKRLLQKYTLVLRDYRRVEAVCGVDRRIWRMLSVRNINVDNGFTGLFDIDAVSETEAVIEESR